MKDYKNIVVNSGPLLVFAKLNCLHLLKSLYGKIIIPEVVYQESVIEGVAKGYSDAMILKFFIERQNWGMEPVNVNNYPEKLKSSLIDKGEKSAIYLASTLEQSLVLLDDEEARKTARDLGIAVKGSLGIFVETYKKGFVSFELLEFYFDEISKRRDIWISKELCQKVLNEVKNTQ